MSRETLFTPEMSENICQRIEQGESLRAITSDEGMPHLSTVCSWFHTHPAFYARYVKAKEIRAELVFDELIEMADDPGVRTIEQVNWMNMRLGTRKWCLSRMNQNRFGEKTNINHGGLEGLAGALLKARERVQE